MSWADRLLRLAMGDPTREVVEHLLRFQHAMAALDHSIAAAAAQAPNAGAENGLRALTTNADRLASALTRGLQERKQASTTAPAAVLNGGGRNHWGRLVDVLEGSRRLYGEILRDTPRLLELDPTLADLLRELNDGLATQLVGLRALIARADPQALD